MKLWTTLLMAIPFFISAQAFAQAGNCSDGTDNDGDGWTDGADPDCAVEDRESGYNFDYTCNDNLDNDLDGVVDAEDSNCAAATDAESGDCADGADNDGDGWVDDSDPDCGLPCETCFLSEKGFNETFACNNGLDDDGDGSIDAQDPDCNAATDNDESTPSCSFDAMERTPGVGFGVMLLPLAGLLRRRFARKSRG